MNFFLNYSVIIFKITNKFPNIPTNMNLIQYDFNFLKNFIFCPLYLVLLTTYTALLY